MVATELTPAGRPPAVGRADFLRALAEGGEERLRASARALGYRQVREPAVTLPETLPAEAGAGVAEAGAEEAAAGEMGVPLNLAPVPFWRLESVEEVEVADSADDDTEPDDDVEVLTVADLEGERSAPEAAPIVP